MRQRWWLALMAAIFVWGSSGMWAAAPQDAPNVTQVDLEQGFQCPPSGQWAEIPDLRLSLQTFGNPVLVMWILNFEASPNGNINIRPVIDGQTSTEDQLNRAIGAFSGQRDILPFTRLYRLPEGLHTFGVEMNCTAGISVFNGWMTVYELPSVKLK
jgi:hypothetical protein